MPLATCVGHGTTGICDMGIPACCSHGRSGTNGQGSGLFEVEGSALHLVGHTGPCNCPHGGTFQSVEGSRIFEVSGIAVTLTGHQTVCMSCGKSGVHSGGAELLEVEA